eukprot:TRINITY_DN4277_c2_g1_i2.p1 TRINITY_DN4277_c2_g1~~TRINITY_DN4277_c2_g1_i2.p1  ORF type:complete len:219 (-),score=37.45 TRINITY_DN4277_c2_g1_i2:169-825(-)
MVKIGSTHVISELVVHTAKQVPPAGPQPYVAPAPEPVMDPLDVVIHIAFCTFFLLILAGIYRKVKSPPSQDDELEKKSLTEWSSGPFDCFANIDTCFTATCCGPMRWSDTLDMAGLQTFWVALMMIGPLAFLAQIPQYKWVSPVVIAIMVYYRQQLRKAFGMEGYGECKTVCSDCMMISCCTCCAIAQEARHVNYAVKTGHEVIASQKTLLEAPEQAA